MPPEPLTNPPALREPSTKALGSVNSSPGLDFVASFYDASELETGYKVEGFTAAMRAEIVARLCKDPDPKIALKALSEDRATRREMLMTSGLLKTARAEEKVDNGEGRTITRTLTSHRLTLPGLTPGIAIRRPIATSENDADASATPALEQVASDASPSVALPDAVAESQ